MKAMQAMTRNVVCVREDDALEVARDLMKEWDIRHLPVVRDRILVGILSDRDVLLHSVGERGTSENQIADRTVGETMTRKPITCSATDSIAHIAGLMVDSKIDCVPVIEEDDGDLIGMITSSDLLDLLREKDILDASRTVPFSYAVRYLGRDAGGYL